jgi:hypothetical protein
MKIRPNKNILKKSKENIQRKKTKKCPGRNSGERAGVNSRQRPLEGYIRCLRPLEGHLRCLWPLEEGA